MSVGHDCIRYNITVKTSSQLLSNLFKLVGQGGKSKKTIGGHGQKDKRSKNIERNTSESGIKCVCLNARSIINKKTELNIMVDDIKPLINKNN